MTILQTILATLLMATTCGQQQPKGWRGIVPLRSTRAEVIRLLGQPNIGNDLYEIDDNRIFFVYSDGPCEKGRPGWNVPPDTVVSISVAPNHELKFADLRIDKKKYRKHQDSELPDIFHYTNDIEGISISVSEGDVRNIYYTPGSKDEHLRCASLTPNSGNSKRREPRKI
jgi:hypothetical protein